MNSTTSTITYSSSLSRSSSRTRLAHQRTQSSTRSQTLPRPAIDTSVPTTYSCAHQSPLVQQQPGFYPAAQGRQLSSSSVASSSSSHTNNSLFTRSRETLTTVTSTGSVSASASTSSFPYEDGLDHGKGSKQLYEYDHVMSSHTNGNVKMQESQPPLSPAESLESIGRQLHSHVLALHDFTPIAPNATCLSFRAGQIIQVLNRDASGWWDGELDGRRGWFPSNYVSGLDQVGRLKDEVLVELHRTNHHESTPSLASWTSSSSSSALQSAQNQQMPMIPSFDAQHSEQLVAEPQPKFTSPDIEAAKPPSPSQKKSIVPQPRPPDFGGRNKHKPITDRATASPTFSLYRAIADGDVSSRAFSPTPSIAASGHQPLLTPLLHALSLLNRAVAARRQAHYQPSTACVISCVRSLLTSTECLHRDAPTLRRVPQLAQERKIILGNLATLVSQARRCSDWPGVEADGEGVWNGTAVGQAEVEQQDWELEQMLRMGGEVLRNVTQFLGVCDVNDIELPISRRTFSHATGSGSSGSEQDMQQRVRVDLGVATPATTPHRRGQSGSTPTMRRGVGSDGAHEAITGHTPSVTRPPVELSAMRTKSLNDLRERRRMQQLERTNELSVFSMPKPVIGDSAGRPPLRSVAHRQIQRPKQLSISSISSLSSGSIDSYGSPLTPPFPTGPCTTAQVLSALRATHDDLLSAIAAFIGHVHSYGRHSHASSKGHLIELARETVDMVRQLLTLVEAVTRHPDVGIAKVETLQTAKDELFVATNDLVEAVRETTSPTASSMSEEDERRRTLHGATSVLKVAADCVSAVKMCLSRPIGEEPFVICLPSLSSGDAVPSLPGTSNVSAGRARPVSYLRRRSASMTSSQEHEPFPQLQRERIIGVVDEDGEPHADEDLTIQAVDASMQTPIDISVHSASSRGSDSTADESDEEDLHDGRSGRSSNEEATQEPNKEVCSPFEEKLLHGDLPVPPVDSTVPATPSSPTPSIPPLDVDSVFASLLSHDYDIRDIAYNPEGAIVGATLDVMVEKMTPHDALVEPAFHQIFMMTWRLFVSPPEFVNALMGRYSLQPPAALKDSDLDVWVKRKATPIKLRIANLIKTWLENYWRPETDDAVLTQLSQFVRGTIAFQFPAPAQRILEIIRARTLSDESIVSPRPIDRTKSVDRLREAPSVPPPPVSPSEIPRPTITKTLFAALKNKNFLAINITEFDALELARQFTIMESKLYMLVQPQEVLELGQTGGAPAINVKAISTLSTAITGWVTESILDESDAKKRTNLVKFFIKVADRCSSLSNYSTSRSILAALDSSTISRLQQTWVALPQKSKLQLESLRKMADHARNYSEYRSRLRSTNPPAVPFLGLYLTDVTFCREGNPSHRIAPRDPNRKLINFNKYHKLARIVQDMQRFQVPYNLKEIPEVQQYLMVQFDQAKNVGDLQDLYRRSLLVEPRRLADAPIPAGDGKPMLQLWGLGSLSRSQTVMLPS
ncbi:ras GEF [Ramaria rubella]|nr:ras GEF [Ramaria rubella]